MQGFIEEAVEALGAARAELARRLESLGRQPLEEQMRWCNTSKQCAIACWRWT